jgi:hypothetical protein
VILLALMLCSQVLADDEADEDKKPWHHALDASIHGDVKSFFVGVFPYDNPMMPDDPAGQAMLDGRLKLKLGVLDLVDFEAHHAVTAKTVQAFQSAGGFGTGVGLQAPEAIELSWTEPDKDALTIAGRTDRLVVTAHLPHFDIGLGRQPISFGSGAFFTPMDLVNPFHPATIDSEYKPGVDAVRVDGYFGFSRVTMAAAYAGDWEMDGLVFAAYGQTTVGVTDLSILLGEVHGDEVLGFGVVTSVGPIGIHGEGTYTFTDDEPFVRAVLGADWRPTSTTTLSGELYLQTVGAKKAEDYLEQYLDERYERGELWAVGKYYAGLAISQEITPTLHGSAIILANLQDPSALVAPTFSWSVAGNAEVGVGAYMGLGKRPDVEVETYVIPGVGETEVEIPVLESEFGLYPVMGFAQMRAYF